MYPKPGNAFAQQKALERQRKAQEENLTTSKNDSPSKSSSGETSTSEESTMTTFAQFTGDLPELPSLEVPKGKSPSKSSPHKRSVTDPGKYSYSHQSALPEPLFYAKPKNSFFSKFTSKSKSNTKEDSQNPPTPLQKEQEVRETEESELTINAVQDNERTEETMKRARSSSRASQTSTASTNSNPKADPVQTIHKSHDTRFAFGPATPSSQQTVTTPMNKYFKPRSPPDGIILGAAGVNPTRDGKFARTKHTQVVEQTRIPSISASVISAPSLTSPTLWVGPDGRIYSGPLLQPLTYQPPVPFDKKSTEDQQQGPRSPLFSGFSNGSSGESETNFSPITYTITSTGAWEQMQLHYPDTMPRFSGPSMKHDSTSSQYSERLSQAENSRWQPGGSNNVNPEGKHCVPTQCYSESDMHRQ